MIQIWPNDLVWRYLSEPISQFETVVKMVGECQLILNRLYSLNVTARVAEVRSCADPTHHLEVYRSLSWGLFMSHQARDIDCILKA